MGNNTVSILDGNTFVVSNLCGDIDASLDEPTGLFSHDTRYLSQWLLRVNGERLHALSVDDLDYFSVQFFLVPTTKTTYIDAGFSILRKRSISDGFIEDITIQNHTTKPIDLTIHMQIDADFADLFEVREALSKKGTHNRHADNARRELLLGYQREKFLCETLITSTAPAIIDEQGFCFDIHIKPHKEWITSLTVTVAPSTLKAPLEEKTNIDKHEVIRAEKSRYMKRWLADAPQVSCEWRWLERIYQRSMIDLAALRFSPNIVSDKSIPAAGLPWFMTIFGRDSIITSLQTLPFAPELAEATLLTLAAWQGTVSDDFRDEEPGKILHELRYGEMTIFGERPHSPYYGTADATPLFLILLDEYERWTGNSELVRKLKSAAKDALTWIDEYGSRNGYVEFNQRNKLSGLENQCWKDSWNAILFADGSQSLLPRATCEIQGYVYDAKIRCARLARQIWHDPIFAQRLEQEASDLKRRFNEDFWLPKLGFFALAIDGSGRKVDSLTSNIGHLLWSGIVEHEKAQSCVDHLMNKRLFSGWGIRTMAENEGGYNPIGYHIGTIWPHDNSLIAWGLRRYGFDQEAARIAAGILEATTFFRGRLPEAFAGYRRSQTSYPVEYPTACSPQAWAAGAPLLFIRVLMGLEPSGDNLIINPAVPLAFGRIDILDLPGRWGHTDAHAHGKIDVLEAGEIMQRQAW